MAEDWEVVRVPSTGLMHYTGISSSYSTLYSPNLHGIISKKEYDNIIEDLNSTISDYWPCDTCYFFGYGCSLCSFGLSIFIPHLCASQAEVHAVQALESYSLQAKHYDRKISFTLKKNMFSSYVEIKFPKSLEHTEEDEQINDLELIEPKLITTSL